MKALSVVGRNGAVDPVISQLPRPAAVDNQLLAALPATLQIEEREPPLLTEDSHWCRGFVFAVEPPAGDLARALAMVERALAPAPQQQIAVELAKMRVSTKSRPADDDDLTLAMQVYADALGELPADVAIATVRWWARNEVWWPSLAELRLRAERFAHKRRQLYGALRNPVVRPAEPDIPPPTPEDLSHVQEVVAKAAAGLRAAVMAVPGDNDLPTGSGTPPPAAPRRRLEPIQPPPLLPADHPAVIRAAAGLLGVDVESLSAPTAQEDAMVVEKG